MPKQLHAAVHIDLPSDEFDAAATLTTIRPLWDQFMAGLTETKVVKRTELAVVETRAKSAPGANGRRARKPRAVATVADLPTVGLADAAE